MRKKLEAVKKIAKRFEEEHITWALGASMLLYFKEIVPSFHDIDVMILEEDAKKAKSILGSMGTLLEANLNPQYQTNVFLEFVIDGIDVDMMAGFKIVKDNQVYDCSLTKEQIVEYYEVDGVKIPLQSLELWCTYYSLMGRKQKVQMIQDYLDRGETI